MDENDSWEPLCKFLNVPIPDVPFPNVNNNDEIKTWIEGNVKTASWFFSSSSYSSWLRLDDNVRQGLRRWMYLLSSATLLCVIGYKYLHVLT